MKRLYDDVSLQAGRMITKNYSTSFSLGIYFLNNRLRNAVYAVYGFVRVADEIVDSFEGFDKKYLLQKFKNDTYEAIDMRISTNPVLNGFQQAVHKYDIDRELIDVFLRSMEMDLEQIDFTEKKYNDYILGSAEVVGLMCLRIFAEGNNGLYLELKPFAMKLGAAFQKVNFLRDMKDDYEVLGRVYFPDVNISDFSGEAKRLIEKDIENDFRAALAGIRKLPTCCKGGVYLAYVYYRALFTKIKKLSPSRVLSQRIRINNCKKMRLMINSFIEFKLNLV